MRKLLSFIFLLFSFVVVGFITSLIAKFINWGYVELRAVSSGIRFVVYILCGTTILGLSISPIYYGVPLTVVAAENIAPSQRGLRYAVFSACASTTCAWVIVMNVLLFNRWPLVYIYMAVFAIAVGISGCRATKRISPEVDSKSSVSRKNDIEKSIRKEYDEIIARYNIPDPYTGVPFRSFQDFIQYAEQFKREKMTEVKPSTPQQRQ